jgi:cytochrome c oxidase cbb3-type subunit IV
MDIGTLQGIGTILAMAAFISICIWAWSSKNQADFDEAAQLPFADKPEQPSDDQAATESEQEVKRGAGHE